MSQGTPLIRLASPQLYPDRADWTKPPVNSAFREVYRKSPGPEAQAHYAPSALSAHKTSSSLDGPFSASHVPLVDRSTGTSRLVDTPFAQARRDEIDRDCLRGKLSSSRIAPAGTIYSAYGSAVSADGPQFFRVQGVGVARSRVRGPEGDRLAGGGAGSPWRARWKEDESASYPAGTWGTSTAEYKAARGSPIVPTVGAPPPRAPPPPRTPQAEVAPAPSPIASEPGPRPSTAPPTTERPSSVLGLRDIQATTSADLLYQRQDLVSDSERKLTNEVTLRWFSGRPPSAHRASRPGVRILPTPTTLPR